ncbi:hypothetical protein GDO86_009159 [Hymenochirus boettgeri]|uniref:tRNA (adenine(58)-N(1))-methyltransferase n=1 Tax=Hymenochirus boettgeri TaxID=247094 RepID=A0A8T2JMN3_9PIPI|nr:hypothetical protein GDO86_009159 [Hymenochirus boettgeri]
MIRRCAARFPVTLGGPCAVPCRHHCRSEPPSPVDDDPRGEDSEETPDTSLLTKFHSRRAWGRLLSPLDRVTQMIPPQFISQDIRDLRGAPEIEEREQGPPETPSNSSPGQEDTANPVPQCEDEMGPSRLLGTPFRPGDVLVTEFKKRHYTEFRKMFKLTESGKLMSNWGAIGHKEIVGKLPGQRLRTSIGFEFLLRRPSLEEFVLFMKRGPTISYPKDITAMLMMMDISPGDVVLEAGSGSGGMTLFLSRAVGAEGCVYSFEIRTDHHLIAQRNFRKWKNAWDIWRSHPWPENVHFINKDLSVALPDMKSVTFDAVALDMLNPHVALPALMPHLKQGGVCAVYLANITQVIDLLEGIRSCQLFLVCEKVKEVSVKDWLVAPSIRKDGTISQRVDPQRNAESELQQNESELHSDSEELPETVKPFGQIPYIARPLPWQTGHTGIK